MAYQYHKQKYYNLCRDIVKYEYRTDPRGVNYYIYMCCHSTDILKLTIGSPMIPQDKESLQNILTNIENLTFTGKSVEYPNGITRYQYTGILKGMSYDYKVEQIGAIEYKARWNPYAKSKWIYIDISLIVNYMKQYKGVRIDTSQETIKQKNNFYVLLSYHTFTKQKLCVSNEIKYYISITDPKIITIYDFTLQEHKDKLFTMKSKVIEWLCKEHKCITDPDHIRIYTYFPNQKYLYPYFFVDYHNENTESFTRIVDAERMLKLDDIIKILEYNGNMKKYYVKYYTPCNSSIYEFALSQLEKTLQLFIRVFENINKKEQNIEEMLEKLLEEDKKLLPHARIPTATKKLSVILYDPENYKYLYYLQKILIGKNTYYPFITQYLYMENTCKRILGHVSVELPTKSIGPLNVNICDFTVIQRFYDYTRPNTSAYKLFSILCTYENKYFIVNFINKSLFARNNICTSTELPLIKTICKTKKSGIWKHTGTTPYIIEVHELACGIKTIKDINTCSPKYSDLLYNYKLVNNMLNTPAGSVINFIKETPETINSYLPSAKEIKIDTNKLNMFAFILYRYTDSNALKYIIRIYFNNIPEEYIYFKIGYPFIVIPDMFLQNSYKNNFKLNQTNFNMVIWYTDKHIYDMALKKLYINENTVDDIINELPRIDDTMSEERKKNILSSIIYPFTLGKIGKFLENNRLFPHTFRYASMELLDQLHIFIYQYKRHMQQLIDSRSVIFDLDNYKLNFIDDLFLFYFHNTLLSNSILHLHMRIKTMTRKLRHQYKGFYSMESNIVHNLDNISMKMNINSTWFNITTLYRYTTLLT